MLDGAELRQILEEVEYRPGWVFSLRENPYEGPYLRIVAPVMNAYDIEEAQHLGIDSYLSPNDRVDRDSFLRFLIWRLMRIETHEAREFLRYRGEIVFDPHRPD